MWHAHRNRMCRQVLRHNLLARRIEAEEDRRAALGRLDKWLVSVSDPNLGAAQCCDAAPRVIASKDGIRIYATQWRMSFKIAELQIEVASVEALWACQGCSAK